MPVCRGGVRLDERQLLFIRTGRGVGEVRVGAIRCGREEAAALGDGDGALRGCDREAE